MKFAAVDNLLFFLIVLIFWLCIVLRNCLAVVLY
jgi:hypothetical protein